MKQTETAVIPDPKFECVDEHGVPGDTAVLDREGIAYDPTQMTVDLTKAEKLRTTALMLAIQAYDKLIIKDAEMYDAISRNRDRSGGPVIQPATMHAMVDAAINFEAFIIGRFSHAIPPPSVAPESPENKAEHTDDPS